MIRWLGHGAMVLVLTVLTQLGGLAWLVALGFRRRLAVFALAYGAIWGAAHLAAPALAGRVALPCFGAPLRSASPLYCVMMRHYVTPELAQAAEAAAEAVAQAHPGTVTLTLDGSFPFFDGVPLLPHLSHDDGEKLDFAFYYKAEDYLPGHTPSPIGYWVFEVEGDPLCSPAWPTLRWGMGWLQPLWPNWRAEPERSALLVSTLAADPRIGKILLEPPLVEAWGVAHPKVRFQGCRAARHDDHIHVQR